jgi:hypothetical protein
METEGSCVFFFSFTRLNSHVLLYISVLHPPSPLSVFDSVSFPSSSFLA